MQRSPIEWTQYTWNPVRGCDAVSPGCDHCYAETFAERFRGVAGHPYEHGFDLRLAPKKLLKPLMMEKPKRIFVNSMSDMFHGNIPAEYVRDIVRIMQAAPWHIYQVLTKRSDRMRRMLRNDPSFREAAAAKHIWWGVSAEDHKHGAPRIRNLLAANAATPWVSFEPLLEDMSDVPLDGIKWAVVGGESGWKFRPLVEEHARNMRDRCEALGIPFLFKQWGGLPKEKSRRILDGRTYDEYPEETHCPVIGRKERHALIERFSEEFREKWGWKVREAGGTEKVSTA